MSEQAKKSSAQTPKKVPVEKKKKNSKKDDELEGLTQDLQRIQADFINFRNRSEEDKMRAMKIGQQSAVEALLPLVDDIELAINHIPKELEGNSWAQGVAQVAKRIEKFFSDMGIERVGVAGENFDPELHEAISFDEDGEGEEVIDETMRVGYKLDGRIIRPAMVKVSKKVKEK